MRDHVLRFRHLLHRRVDVELARGARRRTGRRRRSHGRELRFRLPCRRRLQLLRRERCRFRLLEELLTRRLERRGATVVVADLSVLRRRSQGRRRRSRL